MSSHSEARRRGRGSERGAGDARDGGDRSGRGTRAKKTKTRSHLRIGVDDPELHAVDVAADHAVDGVGTTTADADDLRERGEEGLGEREDRAGRDARRAS